LAHAESGREFLAGVRGASHGSGDLGGELAAWLKLLNLRRRREALSLPTGDKFLGKLLKLPGHVAGKEVSEQFGLHEGQEAFM
jgi:hypothetical protein